MRILLLVAVLGAAGLGAQAPAAAPPPKGDARKGARLFVQYGCYECHGREGQGGAAGPRIAPNAPPITTLIRYVRAPTGEMPPYTATLLKSDQDLVDIHAYLTSRPGAKPDAAPR